MSCDFTGDQIVYEDNHIIVVNKKSSQIVQGDKTGDMCIAAAINQIFLIK